MVVVVSFIYSQSVLGDAVRAPNSTRNLTSDAASVGASVSDSVSAVIMTASVSHVGHN